MFQVVTQGIEADTVENQGGGWSVQTEAGMRLQPPFFFHRLRAVMISFDPDSFQVRISGEQAFEDFPVRSGQVVFGPVQGVAVQNQSGAFRQGIEKVFELFSWKMRRSEVDIADDYSSLTGHYRIILRGMVFF